MWRLNGFSADFTSNMEVQNKNGMGKGKKVLYLYVYFYYHIFCMGVCLYFACLCVCVEYFLSGCAGNVNPVLFFRYTSLLFLLFSKVFFGPRLSRAVIAYCERWPWVGNIKKIHIPPFSRWFIHTSVLLSLIFQWQILIITTVMWVGSLPADIYFFTAKFAFLSLGVGEAERPGARKVHIAPMKEWTQGKKNILC